MKKKKKQRKTFANKLYLMRLLLIDRLYIYDHTNYDLIFLKCFGDRY